MSISTMTEPLHLHVEIDPNSGFCFGVVYAIQMAEDILDEEGMLYCLGDIVHNDREVQRLEAKGLRIIQHEDLSEIQDAKVLIRAHGEPPSTYQIAIENNLTLIDASCPVVLKLQNRIKQTYDKGEDILIYGKHGHAEVAGLLGQTEGKATVFQDYDELVLDELPKEVVLFSQTTKSTEQFYSIKNRLIEEGFEVQAYDTICRQVSNREPQLRVFAENYDKIVFVAGTKSSNGKVLYNTCKSINPETYFISHEGELNPDWFNKNDRIGICGATSTPMWLMEAVKERLLQL